MGGTTYTNLIGIGSLASKLQVAEKRNLYLGVNNTLVSPARASTVLRFLGRRHTNVCLDSLIIQGEIISTSSEADYWTLK